MIKKALTIAGSDSGGGAGIQADLKTFAALGVYGSSVITAITAQNTVAVTAVHEIPTEIIAAQLDAVLSDIGADAAKTGMLSSAPIIATVAAAVRRHGLTRLGRRSGDGRQEWRPPLREDAVAALRAELLPLALVVTPNIPEAEVLAGMTITDGRRAARGRAPDRRLRAALRGRSRGGTRPATRSTSSMMVRRSSRSRPGRGSTRRIRTAPAALSRRRSPPGWPTAWMSRRRCARRKLSHGGIAGVVSDRGGAFAGPPLPRLVGRRADRCGAIGA